MGLVEPGEQIQPGLQLEQAAAPPALKCPSGHCTGLDDGSGHMYPAGQSVQAAAPAAVNVPAAHDIGAEFGLGQRYPAGHCTDRASTTICENVKRKYFRTCRVSWNYKCRTKFLYLYANHLSTQRVGSLSTRVHCRIGGVRAAKTSWTKSTEQQQARPVLIDRFNR
eukprot:COSAG05_NODE_1235_length_5438_cov_19.332272_2_plen_166_part_00